MEITISRWKLVSARAACLHLLIYIVYVETNLLAALVCLPLYRTNVTYSRFHSKRSRSDSSEQAFPNTTETLLECNQTPWLSVPIPIQAPVSSWVNRKPILSWRPPVDFVRRPPSKRRALSMPRRRSANQLSTSNFAALEQLQSSIPWGRPPACPPCPSAWSRSQL